jgi:hypothetical protein
VVVCTVVLVVFAGCDTGEGSDSSSQVNPVTTSATTIVGRPETPAGTTDPRALATTEDGLALPEGEDPAVIGPLGEATAEFETEDGSVEIGEGTVPDMVPSAFPLPDDFIVELSTQTGAEAGFSGRSEQSFADLVDFFSVELVDGGFDAERRIDSPSLAVFDFSGPDGQGSVAISSAPGGGQSILVTFER